MKLDLDYVRGQFPAFEQPDLREQAFFENAGGSYPCRPVVERLFRFYNTRKVQPYGPYAVSQRAGAEMDKARTRLAALLGVETDELSFGPSSTQNTYVLAQAFRQYLSAGDAIIVTNQDHEANSGPWRRLADDGIEVREWRIDPATGHLDLDDLAQHFDGRVRLLCFPHCSNVVGEINDVAAITRFAHDQGAVVCVDGVSYAPHGFPDVGALGADIYLFSAYKTFGPHQGVMVIRSDLGWRLPNQGHFFNADTLYKRFTPAGPDHAQVAACAGMVDYIEGLYQHHFSDLSGQGAEDASADERAGLRGRGQVVHDMLRAYETEQLRPLLAYIAEKNSLRLIGPSMSQLRAPTVTLVVEGQAGSDVAARLADLGIMAGGGEFYARRALEAMGVDLQQGVLRLSFVHYTHADEIEKLIHALERVA